MIDQHILKIILFVGSALLLWPQNGEVPKLKDVYWGPGEKPDKQDTSIRPFKINFSSQVIDDLRYRLNNTRELEPPLENAEWKYGIKRKVMPIIIDYWLNKFDFKESEKRLNKYPQFITNIQGLNIHYLHVKPNLPQGSEIKVLPILIQHGWPGSIVEFHKIIPMLTTPRNDRDFVFEVIAPSLPGFGYSDSPAKIGLSNVNIAHLWKNLMIRLGFDKWYTQAGDMGAFITALMALMYPQHTLGMHSNLCLVYSPSMLFKYALYSSFPSLLLPEESPYVLPLSNFTVRLLSLTGYFHEQATRPDTLGVGMSDSPAGLAAWILEKFFESIMVEFGPMKFEDLIKVITIEELLDNLMLYWAPEKITSTFRLYAESFGTISLSNSLESLPIKVPSACAQFPYDMAFLPDKILRSRFLNMVHRKIMPRGGHFAALAEPKLLADDVFEAITKMRSSHQNELYK